MKTAKDVIADNLPTFAHRAQYLPTRGDLRDAAERIIFALRAEGYRIEGPVTTFTDFTP